jgi:hypothetical protein
LFLLLLMVPGSVSAQTAAPIISSPAPGSILRGLVDILGTSAVDGFFSAELSFAYASDPAQTWFLITSLDVPTSDGLLAQWDTNLVTDGDYDLRLRVTLQDGTTLETFVTGLRIRNLTPTETATPSPTFTPVPTLTPEFDETPVPTLAPTLPAPPTATRKPSPTPLPPNPAAVTQPEITSSLTRGLLAAFLAFIVIGLFLRLRR